jgi:hypothetical protein
MKNMFKNQEIKLKINSTQFKKHYKKKFQLIKIKSNNNKL